MKKWRINWNIVKRNLLIVLNVAVIAILIYIVKTKGISFFSTIGYFD